ncbi:MAG: N-acetyl-D-myo-inositol-2-amino-2-deoxy-alpha-D-glucopyranoside deacetylase [Pseudonocardiales bacterium]|nr:N-acetyl-D-myo-inositol-2-amino-2-deoxy-alpha-D-glucopyranoside deacetylase [Pseudonocardiales bacterium]MDQ1753057.1 N-acetyl-D-myo-inositol-2-amino-2-deoxy-alpha-D-glucopyranoside deacetylase [Pseudonocardiales bacterium]
MTTPTAARRLLLVHAHPDDESIGTGATMAKYVAAGDHVTLVTCTLGEEGEILVPALSQLAADQADQLGGWRITELASAMAELGVTDHRYLGGAGRFRDSGMMGTPANEKPRAFWRADSDRAVFYDAVLALVEVIREIQPQVVVTYDDFGGYGHPDHIMAHRVATAAVSAAAQDSYVSVGGRPWQASKVYWTATPRSVLAEGLEALRNFENSPFADVESVDDIPFVVDDELVTTCIDADDFIDAKAAALTAHATQISIDGPFFALSNNLGQKTWGTEYYRLAAGTPGGPVDLNGRETDLFGGLDV